MTATPATVQPTALRTAIGRQKGDSIMRISALSLAIIALASPMLAAAPARALDTRTWVSGTGDDANPCSRIAPCKTFGVAIQKTTPGGEINCVNPGSFGGVSITKAITISCKPGTAGILGPGGISIAINAAATDVVTLRGLDIDGQGVGSFGIGIFSAKAVHVEKCTIRYFQGNSVASGITTFANSSSTVFLFVVDTVISNNAIGVLLNSGGGFKVASLNNVTITGSTSDGLALVGANLYANVTKSIISGNGGSAVIAATSSNTINVDRSTIANNGTALNASASGATIRISDNNIFNNTTGFSIASGATIASDHTNSTGGSNGGALGTNAVLTKN